jgi:phage shock protein A
MQLFRRVGDIIAANLNDLVDRFEDPEVMLRQAIREMETMIEDATVAAARAVASERLLSKDLADHERKALSWRAAAEEAVAREEDAHARQAIVHAHEHEALARTLVQERSSAGQTAQTLCGQLNAMRAKLAEARGKLASLTARRQVVEVGRSLRRTASQSPRGARGFTRFERMRRRVEQAEAEAEALGELCEDRALDPDSEAAARERARRVEADLVEIRERLRRAPKPQG